jgi:hypothetical protein
MLTEKKTSNIEGFDSFIDTANEIHLASKDYRFLGNEIKPFVDSDGLIRVNLGDENFQLTDWSLSQLAQKLGVPAAYATKMADAGKRDLFVANFQSWIDSHHAGKQFFVRTYGDTVRGFLSDSYFPTDTHSILPLVRDSLQTTNMNFQVHKGAINPEYTNIRMVSDREIRVGDDPHFVGMSVSTSDVGRASMKMEFFVYRQACTNGMLFGKHSGILFQKTHKSRHLSDNDHFLKEVQYGLKDLDALALTAENMLRDAHNYKLKDDDMNRIIREYRAYARIGEKESDGLRDNLNNFMTGYDTVKPTLWSVSNAFTEMAQQHKIEKSEVMENFAGHLLFSRLGA